MNIDLRPYLVIWVLLAAGVGALVIRRKMVTRGEDESVHVLESGASMSTHQVMVAQKLEVIDRWGKILTAVAVAFGLVLGAVWAYQLYMTNSGIVTGA